MNKAEFTDRVKGLKYEDLSEDDWELINTVYTFHPMISNVKGKDEIADLFKRGGMGIIRDMFDTADEIRRHESNIQSNSVALENLEKQRKAELEALQKKYAGLAQGIRNDTASANQRLYEINESFATMNNNISRPV